MSVYRRFRKNGSAYWYYDFVMNGIRYKGNGGATKTQALRIQEKRRNEIIASGNELPIEIPNQTFEQFMETYLSRRTHLRSYRRDDLSARTLRRFFRGKSFTTISPADIEDYIVCRRKEGVSNATINRELACLKRMYNLAIKWDMAKRNPVIHVKFLEEPPGRTKCLCQEDCMRLIACSADHLRPILITALNTGMRLGEILSLKWHHVHLNMGFDAFVEIEHAKNNKRRFIPLTDDMVELFQSLKGNGSEYVFLGPSGRPLKRVTKAFSTALKEAKIQDFRFHDLRHTFASHFLMQGGDLISLKEILGHSNLKMVQRYAHAAFPYKRQLISNMNGMFSDRKSHHIPTANHSQTVGLEEPQKVKPRNSLELQGLQK